LKNSVLAVVSAMLLGLVGTPWFGHDASSVSAAPAMASAAAQVGIPSQPGVRIGNSIDLAAAADNGVSEQVLEMALHAIQCGIDSGDLATPPTLTLIDYSLPSVEPRLWVFDLATGEMLFKELVAHGQGTGDNMASRFSDNMNSHQSSLGLFVTADTYVGNNGYSLRLDGLEPGFNSRARERAIVMHGAPYVNASLMKTQGRLGRSWGCPALREAVARDVIDTIRGGGVIFSYYPDERWLSTSRFLNCGHAAPAGSSIAAAD
jgi:hypothetical protein